MESLCLIDMTYNIWAITWFGTGTQLIYTVLLVSAIIGYTGFIDGRKSQVLAWSWVNFITELVFLLMMLNPMYLITVLYRSFILYKSHLWCKNVYEEDTGSDIEAQDKNGVHS